jgi:uncharacterized membrane protein
LTDNFRPINVPNTEPKKSVTESPKEDTKQPGEEDTGGEVISQKENIEKNLKFMSGKEFGGRWSVKVSITSAISAVKNKFKNIFI